MKQNLTLLLLLITASAVTGQTNPKEYPNWIKKADSLYKMGDYKNSGWAYSQAFKSLGWKGYLEDRYSAARAWAHAAVPDSAFSNLSRIATRGNYSDYEHLMSDADLQSLHKDPRWHSLSNKVKENKERIENYQDKKLVELLDSLVKEDQKWRNYMTKYYNKQLKDDTISLKSIQAHIQATDSLNYFQLKNVFSKRGFPNFDLVGISGSHNFWLLMQHQDLHPQFQEEALVKMKDEADKGKAELVDYAYLLDRVKVNTSQLQVYGTQMILNSTKTSYEPKPVIDPDKLNERRRSIGLEPIESYIETMNSRYFGTLNKN